MSISSVIDIDKKANEMLYKYQVPFKKDIIERNRKQNKDVIKLIWQTVV